ELYLAIFALVQKGNLAKAREIQYATDRIIYALCACKGNLYAAMKEIIKLREGIDIGSVRAPLAPLCAQDAAQIAICRTMIDEAIAQYNA
ncbi:MAG: N-acetylneuraminate lyase, partial [Ruthenibacterium sp.]